MTTLTIILLIYVALDIILDLIVLGILLFRGWTLRGIALAFLSALRGW